MSIYTPTGLKLNISIELAFGLMSRLFPKISPFMFLKYVEGLESLPMAISFLVGVFSMLNMYPPYEIALYTFSAYLFGFIISFIGTFNKYILWIGTLYSYLSGYGLYIFIASIIGYFYSDIKGIIGFFIAKLFGYGVVQLIDVFYIKYYNKKHSKLYSTAERNFFSVYKYFAFLMNKNPETILTSSEILKNTWKKSYEHLNENWPSVTKRFD